MNIPTSYLAPCAAFDDDLKAYLDGELPLLARWKVRRHLQNCPQCREEIQLMERFSEEIKGEETAPLDAGLSAEILKNAPHYPPPPLKDRRRTVKKLGLATAGFALMVAVGFNASQPFSGQESVSLSAESSDAGDAISDSAAAKAPLPSANPAAGAASDAVSAAAPLSVPPLAMRGNANSAAPLEQRRSPARREAGSAGIMTLDDLDSTFADGGVKNRSSQPLYGAGSGNSLENGAPYAPLARGSPRRQRNRRGR